MMTALVALALTAVAPTSAPASDGSNPDAKKAFQRGKKYFELEEYKAAVRQFRLAYQLSGRRPSTILALAQAERQLGRYDDALEHYREYLATEPEDKEQIQETIVLLQELQQEDAADKKRNAALAESAPPPDDGDGSLLTNPWLWVAVGAVVVGGGVTGALFGAGVVGGGEAEPYGGTSGVIIGE